MKTFVSLALAGVASAITQNDIKFMDHLAKHGKGYDTISEFNLRAAIFAKADARIAKSNANPEHTFTLGHNKFSDWTDAELEKINGSRIPKEDEELPTLNMEYATGNQAADEDLVFAASYAIKYPSSKDWRSTGAVTGIKDQG